MVALYHVKVIFPSVGVSTEFNLKTEDMACTEVADKLFRLSSSGSEQKFSTFNIDVNKWTSRWVSNLLRYFKLPQKKNFPFKARQINSQI